MSEEPILLLGGSGVVGRWAARHLRARHPDAPLLIGGRDRARADEAAAAVGHAEGVAVDLGADGLGLAGRSVGAVAVLFMDDRAAGLRFAQARGVPYVSIAPLLHEIAPEVAYFALAPGAAPVVLGTEWLVGATTMPTLDAAAAFERVDTIEIAALLDDEDTGGPAQLVDLERVTSAAPPTLSRRDGAFVWHGGEAPTTIRAVDGTAMPATPLSPHDVVALAAATDAPNIRFDLATGVTSSRRRGEPMSTEIVVALAGRGLDGRPLKTRFGVVHPEGQMPLTGLGVALVLERLTGLVGTPPPPGLYFPSQLLDPGTYRQRLRDAGGSIQTLPA